MKCEAGYLVRMAAEEHRNRIAVTYNNTNYTFAQINQWANLIGSGLHALGLCLGDRVGLLAYNSPEVLASLFGCEKAGLVRVVLHSHLDPSICVKSLNDVGAKVLIFDDRFSHEIALCRKHMTTVRYFVAIGQAVPEWALSFEQLMRSGNDAELLLDVEEDAPCFIQLTSGTTGSPKPWTKTYRSWLAVIMQNTIHLNSFGSAPPISTNDVNLHCHPIQSSSGFKNLYPYFLRGARSVIMDDQTFNPGDILETVERERVTGMLVHGRLLGPLLDAAEEKESIEHRLQRVVVSFATPQLLSRFDAIFGPVWCHTYGATEQGSAITRLLPADVADSPARMSSVGRVAGPLVEIAIMDRVGQRVPDGSIGEIAVRGPMSAGWYWERQEESARVFFDHDWFRSGDAGYIEGGYLYFLDRVADLIYIDGAAVCPYTIESALLEHECVANCGVVTLPDEADCTIFGTVQLKPGYLRRSELEGELLSWAASRLPLSHRPQRIVFLDTLPTVQGGAKVRRNVIRELLKGLS